MNRKLVAIVDMALRKSPDQTSPLWEEFYEWPAGTEFEPPPHLRIDKAFERHIAAWADDPEAIAECQAWIAEQERLAREATERLNGMDETTAIEGAERHLAREREQKALDREHEKSSQRYLKEYEKRQAEETRVREAEAAAQAEREAVNPNA